VILQTGHHLCCKTSSP